MPDLSSLFIIHVARSKGFDSYKLGKIPFVSNSFYNNGVVGFVEPRTKDRVFQYRAICLSAFCEATVQEPPFLPRGNGGSGLLVLEPRDPSMSQEEMLFHAAFINEAIRWRFSFGRMVSKERVPKLQLKDYNELKPSKTVAELEPKKPLLQTESLGLTFGQIRLERLFRIFKRHGRYREDVEAGNTPLVSSTNFDNGVLDYVNIDPTVKAPAITLERISGASFVQLEDFATVPDDISVFQPIDPNTPLSVFFITAATLNSERWRFSYYRKLTRKRLDRLPVKLPVDKKGNVDFEACDLILKECLGWTEISSYAFKKFQSQLSPLDLHS